LVTDRDLSLEQRQIFARLEQGIGEHDAFESWPLPTESEDVEALLAARRQRDLAYWSNVVMGGLGDPRSMSASAP
jgi:hypothetical protein